MHTSIHDSKGIELTEVPPPITPTLYVVFGLEGTGILDSFAIALPSAYAGLTSPNDPKLCPPGPLNVTLNRLLPIPPTVMSFPAPYGSSEMNILILSL